MSAAVTEIHKLPSDSYIDALRFLPQISTFSRHVILSTYSPQSQSPFSLQTLTLSPNFTLTPHSSLSTPSRITNLQTHPSPYSPSKPLIAASTLSGSISLYTADLITESLSLEREWDGIHKERVSGIGVSEGGGDIVSVGEDGRVNLVNVMSGGVRRVFDSVGLVQYTAVKWASPVEFVTGGFGFGMHWWDLRKNGGPVAVFKGDWAGARTSGIVHSIDIHLSRKHACLAGGSSGTVFAWDIRRPQDSVVLSGVGIGDSPNDSLAESDIWEVQYDNYTNSSKMGNLSSSRILPAMICSEDGILGVIEQGEEPTELLAEPCAINSFDIDKQNPSFGMGINSHLVKAMSSVAGISWRKEQCVLFYAPLESNFARFWLRFDLSVGVIKLEWK